MEFVNKKNVRIFVDAAMLGLFIFEMSLREGRGLSSHALVGTILFVLFIAHHFLNLQYYKAFFKGKYKIRRIVTTAMDTSLFAAMVMLIFTSVKISGMAWTFMPFQDYNWIIVHKSLASWIFFIMIFHLGMHTHGLLNRMKWALSCKGVIGKIAVVVGEIALFVAGLFSFIQSRLWSHMIFMDRFVRGTELWIFYLQYAVIAFAGCLIVHWILKFTSSNGWENLCSEK